MGKDLVVRWGSLPLVDTTIIDHRFAAEAAPTVDLLELIETKTQVLDSTPFASPHSQ